MSAEVADVLDKAAEVIETRGWFQGYYYPREATDVRTCQVCALGAIAAAVQNGDPDFEDVALSSPGTHAAARLGALVDPECGAVDEWNDTPGRTKGEVIATLRAAAEAERAS